MATLVTNIGELRTLAAGDEPRRDAALVIDGGRIAWIGSARDAPAADEAYDAEGGAVLPGWVDSHTHLVFAGDRAAEFEERMAGRPYAAGGIHRTVAATRAASDDELRANLRRLRAEAAAQGTTFLETKTGYALDVEGERRSAEIAAEVADVVTFLGAHVVPEGADPAAYLTSATGPMLAAVRPHVAFVDVFCEAGAFDPDQARAVLEAGRAAGLRLKVHGNQLGQSGGVALAVELGATSVDHANHLSAVDVDALAASDTVVTLLPCADLSTRQPFPPARALLDAGATVALATNANPGSSFTTSMAFCIATAVLQLHLTVDEALRAATRGGARALGRDPDADGIGALVVGGPADLQLLAAPSASHLAYRPGVPLTRAVWKGGVRIHG
ncbi:imidazolonepropionase [Pseudolysinimonas sp.]|uniref:imidazolonepropionase n=1 Tax=Pseudolysinimonas sp. TaxID=2680009 RepID=UPI003F7F8483